MNRFLTFIVTVFSVLSVCAQERYIQLNKNDVNLRQNSSTSSPIVKKGKKGTLLSLKNSKQGWYEVVSLEGEKEAVWAAKSVANELEDYLYNEPFMMAQFVCLPDSEIGYEKTVTKAGGEEHEIWRISSQDPQFWESEKFERPIVAVYSYTTISNNGRMFTNETEYKGTCNAAFVVLQESSIDGGTTWDKLESPIYIYPSFEPTGIYVDGILYNDQNAM